MCGIAGLIGQLGPAHRSALDRMNAALGHRGPDGLGVWISPPDADGAGCMLGHRRLAILDLSHAADQPMVDTTGGATRVIVFNGEIYNFKDLRAGLEADGERFTSSGDTAVMLRLLAREGPDGVARLRGMFAFALWEQASRRLLLARDPLGIKPLYVCRNPDPRGEWSLLFASEVRALLASGLVPSPRLDRRAVDSILWNGFVTGPVTAVDGIELLGPGEHWIADHGRAPVKTRYWQIPAPGDGPPASEDELREVLRDSVARHLISDVPVGVFLSGGIDSSAVAALAQQASGTPVHTFTLSFDEAEYDEGGVARAVARAIGTVHRDIRLTEADFAAALDTAIDTLDQPTFDGLNSYYISRAVREAGLTVALLGSGGDELFGGYPTFSVVPTLQRWARRTAFLPAALRQAGAGLVSRALAGAGEAVPPQTRWAKLPAMARAGDDQLALYQLAYALFLPAFQEDLLGGPVGDGVRCGLPVELARQLEAEAAGRPAVAAVAALEQRLFLGERLLRDTDATSMAVSLETRLPLVDSVVVETATRRPPDALALGRKAILRRMASIASTRACSSGKSAASSCPSTRGFAAPSATPWTARCAIRRPPPRSGSTAALTRLWEAFQRGRPASTGRGSGSSTC
ncbi:MAG: asparagine synthase (glutamine-hydrolyzing) [Vicinamibacterales bacterium]